MKPKGVDAPAKAELNIEVQKEQTYLLDLVLVRTIFAIALTSAAWEIKPFGFEGTAAIALGLFGCSWHHLFRVPAQDRHAEAFDWRGHRFDHGNHWRR